MTGREDSHFEIVPFHSASSSWVTISLPYPPEVVPLAVRTCRWPGCCGKLGSNE